MESIAGYVRRHLGRVALAATLATLGVLTAASSASAVELQGPWAPFNQCPVDDPQMLAVPDSGNGCVSSVSSSGTFKLGKLTNPIGRTEVQFGTTGPGIPNVIPPGYLAADPVKVAGGLLGIMCPAGIPTVQALCKTLLEDNALNRVTATVELAGSIHDFNLFAPFSGEPTATIPVRVHLHNPLLGANCAIGSTASPIVLQPHQDPLATGLTFDPDPLGSSASFIGTTPSPVTMIDSTFSAPKASGCGLLGLFNGAVNGKVGLPSPSGNNQLVENDTVNQVVGNATSGQALSDAWHAAVLP